MMSFKVYKWSFIERILVQLFQLIIIITLSRFLTPDDFGLFGLSAVTISIAQVFVDGGFSAALIRKKTHSDVELNSVFIINIFIALLLISLVLVCSPLIENYFNIDGLANLLNLSSLVILINAFSVIPKVVLTVNLNFRGIAESSLIAVLSSGILSIILAVNNFGASTLVFQLMIYNLINLILIIAKSKWLPRKCFDMQSVKELCNFSIKLFASGLLDALYQNIYLVLIGKLMSVHDVGIFAQAKKLSDIPALTITTALQRANLAATSKLDENDDIKKSVLKTLQLGMFIMAPAMFFIISSSEPLVNVLLGDNWKSVSGVITILSLSGLCYPIHVLNQNILIIKGRSDLHLKLEIVKKCVGLVLIFITISHGLTWLCWGIVISSILSIFVNAYYSNNLVHVTICEQLKVCITPIFLAIISLIISTLLCSIPINSCTLKFLNIKDVLLSAVTFMIVFVVAISYFCRKENFF
ncbi:lipopolysaccharide biosynthesis protein [Escherichia coli]